MESSRHLVFIPWPLMGHIQIVELAKLIIDREPRISVTVLLMQLPSYKDTVSSSFLDSLSATGSASTTTDRLKFLELPPANPTAEWNSKTRGYFVHNLVLSQKSNVEDFVKSHKPNVVGFVVDMLCTGMIDVAEKFQLPSYVFFASPASFLGSMLHFQTLQDEKNQDVTEFENSNLHVLIPSFENPVPANVLSDVLVDKDLWFGRFLDHARGYRKAKAIIVNTFEDLESYALSSFSTAYGRSMVPPVYSVGSILNRTPHPKDTDDSIMKWLDEQSAGSVVFLCFGSQGGLSADQVKELAGGLERSGCRFLWSLRRLSEKGKKAEFPSEYSDFGPVLPEAFLVRTAGVGKVVGWVPQVRVLSHPAVGGFVSHCGWNSVLESIWCGVPIGTWPLHAEQKMNAFQLVKELGLGVEICWDDEPIVTAEEIERGLRKLMEIEDEARKKVKEMEEKSRMSMEQDGSSYTSLGRLIHHIMTNYETGSSNQDESRP
ncbi:UDP-glycosyltransferase 71B7 [Abeliophyllum distichum]|uniref:Glycosyltransferase n=1 Tax=Abeliophyllum distichum TaxID=126358 RepID=A0ABD1RWF5_9LAMI